MSDEAERYKRDIRRLQAQLAERDEEIRRIKEVPRTVARPCPEDKAQIAALRAEVDRLTRELAAR